MSFSSRELYGGRLKAHVTVAQHTLRDLPTVRANNDEDDDDDEDDDCDESKSKSYEEDLLKPVLFINTDGCDMNEDGE